MNTAKLPYDPPVARILERVAEDYGLQVEQLKGRSHVPHVVSARHVAMYLARRLGPRSFPQVGRAFNRHHSTVIYAVRQVEKNAGLRDYVERVERELRDGKAAS